MRNIEKQIKKDKDLQDKLDLILKELERIKEVLNEREKSKGSKKTS